MSRHESEMGVARYAQTGLEYDRPVPPEWTTRLRQVSPVSDAHGYLELVWEPGDAWGPVERWMLYEVLDPTSPVLADAIDAGEMAELRGPHPRSAGHICTTVPTHAWRGKVPRGYLPCLCRHKTEAWRRGPCSVVTLTQWRLYQRTGLVGRPFWVIQGRTGGHRLAFTHQEALLLDHAGYPTTPPSPGALPYAEFDNRVCAQIVRFNRLMQFRNNLQAYRTAMTADGYAKVRAEGERELRVALVAHLEQQMQAVNEHFVRGVKHGEADGLPRSDVNWARLAEESEAAYIETGNVLHESAVQ